MKKIAVFASGNGSNFEAIAEAVEQGRIPDCEIALCVCDKPGAYVLNRARNHNIPTCEFNPKDFKKKSEYEGMLLQLLEQLEIDLICLAGYMRIVGKTLLEGYERRIINIHPALLPSFPGAHGIRDAFDYGVKVFGVTIHYVNETVDGGAIIDQRALHYDGNDIDELETQIHRIEHQLYPEVIAKLLN